MTPPAHLQAELQARKQVFDTLNVEILEQLLAPLALRPSITKEDVVETFRQFQDFINARYQPADMDDSSFEAHEASCRKALNILLYGASARKEEQHV